MEMWGRLDGKRLSLLHEPNISQYFFSKSVWSLRELSRRPLLSSRLYAPNIRDLAGREMQERLAIIQYAPVVVKRLNNSLR